MLSYLSILTIVIAVLNTYPIIISRDLVFISKHNSLQSQANQISTSIGALDSLTQNTVENVMNMLDISTLSRITILNSDSDVLYQDVQRSSAVEKNAEALLKDALSGNDSFLSSFSNGVFASSVAVPIVSKGQIVGTVYIYELDPNEGAIILALQSDLCKISIALALLTIIVCVLYSSTFTRRITRILKAIKNVREGEYTYRIDVKGHDELSQLSEEFNSLTTRLQTTEETRRRFVADASHELKTPLAAIRLLSDSIIQTPNIDSETVNEFVTDIRDESERLARTTAQLLDLTKLDNNISTVRSSIDCALVTERVIRTLRPISQLKNVKVNYTYDKDCCVLSTEDDVYQIIINLIENAIKYNVENGTVNVDIHCSSSNVIIKISDTGIGIPDADIPYIFDRFYRVDKSRNREIGGSGLGLSIVKSTAEKHGGEITVEKNYPCGMTFIVNFPLYSSGIK